MMASAVRALFIVALTTMILFLQYLQDERFIIDQVCLTKSEYWKAPGDFHHMGILTEFK